jgi:hypothetical protein
VTSYDPLTAGETYVFTIQAKDIFQNVVLNSEDRINFELRGPASSIPSEMHEFSAGMEYRFQLHEATVRLLGKGEYSGTIVVTQKGGLLATYYATVDFAFPVLRESLHGHAAAVGSDAYVPSDTTNSTTHFTRLDANVSFNVGKTSILAGLEESFPTQFFSVEWSGWLSPITSSLYRIHVDTYHAAYHELQVGSEARITSEFLPTEGALHNTQEDIEGETYVDVWLEADVLVPIKLRYAQKLGETKVRLLWENDLMEKVIIDAERLYHSLGS